MYWGYVKTDDLSGWANFFSSKEDIDSTTWTEIDNGFSLEIVVELKYWMSGGKDGGAYLFYSSSGDWISTAQTHMGAIGDSIKLLRGISKGCCDFIGI